MLSKRKCTIQNVTNAKCTIRKCTIQNVADRVLNYSKLTTNFKRFKWIFSGIINRNCSKSVISSI